MRIYIFVKILMCPYKAKGPNCQNRKRKVIKPVHGGL